MGEWGYWLHLQPEDGQWLVLAHIPDPRPWLTGSLACWQMAARPPYSLPSQHVFPPTASHHHQFSNKTFGEKLLPQMAMETPCHLGEPAVSKPGFVGKGRNWGEEAPLLKCYCLIPTTTLQGPCLYSLFRGVDTGAPPGTLPRGGAGTITRALCELPQEIPAQSPFSRSHLGEVEAPL